MHHEKPISFVSDGLKLSGVLHPPDAPPVAVIVGCHGLKADKHSPKQLALASRCMAERMAYFRFDHRGCGASEGVFEEHTTLANRRADLIAAVQTAKRATGADLPIGLFGSSLGGTVCLAAAQEVNPFAVVTLAAPIQSRSVRMPADSPASLINDLVANRLSFDIRPSIRSIHHILVIHGSADETVPTENAHSIYDLARPPKEKIILPNGDHRISERSQQNRFIDTAVRWFVTCYREQFRTIRLSPMGDG
jgi:uncharacterized protein